MPNWSTGLCTGCKIAQKRSRYCSISASATRPVQNFTNTKRTSCGAEESISQPFQKPFVFQLFNKRDRRFCLFHSFYLSIVFVKLSWKRRLFDMFYIHNNALKYRFGYNFWWTLLSWINCVFIIIIHQVAQSVKTKTALILSPSTLPTM